MGSGDALQMVRPATAITINGRNLSMSSTVNKYEQQMDGELEMNCGHPLLSFLKHGSSPDLLVQTMKSSTSFFVFQVVIYFFTLLNIILY